MRRENILTLWQAYQHSPVIVHGHVDGLTRWLVEQGYVKLDTFIYELRCLLSTIPPERAATMGSAQFTGRPCLVITDKGRDYIDRKKELLVRRGVIKE